MLNKEPELGKNFWLALALSMLVIFAYPLFMKWISPPAPEISKEEGDLAKREEAPPISDWDIAQRAEEPAGYLEALQPPSRIQIDTEFYAIEFSALGGTITRLFYKGEGHAEAHTETTFFEGSEIQPGLFALNFLHDSLNLSKQIFQVQTPSPDNRRIEFLYEKPQEYRVAKIFTMDPREPVIHLEVRIENLSDRERHFPAELSYALAVDESDNMYQQHHEAVVATEKIVSANLGKLKKKEYRISENVRWAGLLKKYFALLIKPEWDAVAQTASAGEERMWGALLTEPVSLRPGETASGRFLIYAGPQRYETLKQFGYGFEEILSKGFFGMFKIWLLLSLKFLNQFTHNYGWAIVLLTLIIKGIFAPLTHISYKSMKKMQVIQPKIKGLQERYKKDPEKLNREMMDLFRRNKVNPMAGCLPMLIQMPILFAMFRLLPEAIELKDAPFIFWINDLSSPDRLFALPFEIPLLGWGAVNLLPILMIFSQFGYQKLMPTSTTSPEQAKIMNIMPIFFGFICYNMPSGLVLYWFVQNLLSIIQQVFINRIVIALHHQDQD